MTARKHLKKRVRARMSKTGESYTTARHTVTGRRQEAERRPEHPWHFPGSVPAATALRVLLAHAGVIAPHTGEPFSEAMAFGLAGGVGAGACAFHYEKENFSSFFVAGRHLWLDDLTYLRRACERLGGAPAVRETGSTKTAERHLREALAEGGPCVAWVDMGHLPHRAMPGQWAGCGYHVVTVYALEDDAAVIGDLAAEPLRVPPAALAAARARIKKDKNRLLSLPRCKSPRELAPLVRAGLRACHEGLVRQPIKSLTLDAFRVWAERLHGSKDKQGWEHVFKPGPNLWRGLLSVYDFAEHYGTGGGLCRPLFAEFLRESAAALGDRGLRSLGERYADLGRGWSELARSALPDGVPLFREGRELAARKAELTAAGAPAEKVRPVWDRLGELEGQARERFPLSAAECGELRAALQKRVLALHAGEVAAHTALGAWLA